MKEISSIKSLATAARPNPLGIRPPSRATQGGPIHFPPDLLEVDNDDSMAPPPPVGDTDTTPSPPDTPTPTPKMTACSYPPTPQNRLPTSLPHWTKKKWKNSPISSFLPSLPPPHGGQRTMLSHPTPPPLPFSPSAPETSEEEDLHPLFVSTPPPHQTPCPTLPPTPEGGFPIIHLSHAASPFDHIDHEIINAWIQVGDPKFLVRVFDYDGKDHENMNTVITQCIRNSIAEIVKTHNLGPINVRVAPPPPPTVMNMIIHQCIWSSQEITIEAHPFISRELPTTFFCLNGFTTTNENCVRKAVYDTWTSPQVLGNIVVILEKSEIPLDRCYDAAMYLCDSISVEFIDYKGPKAISLPHFNIYAKCPSNRPKIWTNLGATLMTIHYPTPLDGKGIAIPFTTCSLCHAIGHPTGLCKFPDLPLWNGPKHKNKSAKYTPKVRGKGKDACRV
ncbi:hypothetical protein DFJ58DRAFT_732477 [Suillus subalutaceus]|uniref:uncharacterized protein n=1 Tax=Suillus subalutaceus TaxID=48586 RepID=UPI001B85E4B9|nr:uncharacterized protein DFJ58DRAFT_732477 [Suillus subalutaceus]KAG1841303.1 hypothetical protein DFJ58DRAFT_732477 [Suillus subalutaceus]